MIDIYHSRRLNFQKCYYWAKDSKETREDLVHQVAPSGSFYANEVSNLSKSFNPIHNAIMFERGTINLQTDDIVDDLKQGCIVKYRDEYWFVVDIQYEIHKKESQFEKNMPSTKVISLRK